MRTGTECNPGACYNYLGEGGRRGDFSRWVSRIHALHSALNPTLPLSSRHAGIQESEVEGLAGIKEGCEDEVEFLQVERPATGPKPAGE